MKLVVLAAALAFGIPVIATAAIWSTKVRGYLLSLMIALTVEGSHSAVNLVSRELYRGPDRGFEFTATDLLCWALIVAMVARFPRRIDWFPRGTLLLLLFFLNACVLATSAAQPLYTAFSLWKCLRIFTLYWCTVNCLRLGTHRSYVWLGYAGAALVISVLAIEQKYLLGLYRVHGPFDHSNTIPLYANLILPVLLIWGLCDREMAAWKSVASVGFALGLLFAVVCTFSRAGIAFAGACFIAAVIWSNFRSSALRVRAGTLVLGLVMLAGIVRVTGPIISRIQTAPKASEEARDEFNAAARMMLHDFPMGVGLNNFSYVLTNHTQYRERFQAMKNEQQSGVCHHIYWLTVAETGYVGLALYLAIILRFAWTAGRGALLNKSIHGTLLFGILLGLGALQASGFFEWAFRVTPVMQMFMIQAAVAVAWMRATPQKRTATPAANERLTISVLQESYS